MNVKTLRSNSNRYQVRLAAVVLLALVVLAFGAVVAGASHASSSGTVKTRKISGLGVVLVNKSGRTLYVFAKDQQRKVTCKGACTSYWHPLKKAGALRAGGAAKRSLLGSVKNPSGGRVVTYNKWPLYTYVGDSAAGQATGEAKNLSGGKWYVISAKGKVIKHRSSSGGGGTTTSGGGGGWG